MDVFNPGDSDCDGAASAVWWWYPGVAWAGESHPADGSTYGYGDARAHGDAVRDGCGESAG